MDTNSNVKHVVDTQTHVHYARAMITLNNEDTWMLMYVQYNCHNQLSFIGQLLLLV